MPRKMILEARINEYAMRDQNPHVPWTPDEIADTAARCREAGASIVHFHARNPDGPYLTGHPGTPDGLDAHLRFLPAGVRCEWSSNVVGGNLLTLAQMSARLGGHIAPGIGDYAYPELGCPPNEQIVRMAADIARQEGREIATPDDARALLGLPAKSNPV